MIQVFCVLQVEEFVCTTLEERYLQSVWARAQYLYRVPIATKDMDGIQQLSVKYLRVSAAIWVMQ